MKKVTLFFVLFLIILFLPPRIAYSKVFYGTRFQLSGGVTKKYLSKTIYFGIYNYKKFNNIQKANKSLKNYMFFISLVMAKPIKNSHIRCETDTIFVTNKYNTDTFWSGSNSTCNTDNYLIKHKGGINKGLKSEDILIIARLLSGANKYYHLWK